MKKFSIAFLLGISVSMSAQTEDNYHFDDYITRAFDNMFGDLDYIPIPETNPPTDPPVPLDGGLTALLLAGGAAGYRQYKKKKR